jgi:hypothetical protein
MNEMKRASRDEAPIVVCKRERHKNVPTRETSLTIVEISRAPFAIPEEFGAVLGRKILEKRIDCDQLLDLLNSVEVPTRETSLTTAEISRALFEIPEEFGAVLGRNILEKGMDCDHLGAKMTIVWRCLHMSIVTRRTMRMRIVMRIQDLMPFGRIPMRMRMRIVMRIQQLMSIGSRCLHMFIVPRCFQLMSARPLLQLGSSRSLLLPMDKTSRLGPKMVIFFCGTLEISCEAHCNTF